MKNKFFNQSGMSLIDVMIGLSILAFFVAFLPQVFSQSQKLYQSSTKRSEMDRTKQVMLIAAKNVERLKRNLRFTIESQNKSYDQFLNCFGQKGPTQPVKLPGVQCDQKFSGINSTWTDLKEAPVGAGVENLFWRSWGSQGACAEGASDCLMNSWAKYYISCVPSQCFSVHLTLGITPTANLMVMSTWPDLGGYSSQDFKEQKMQMSFPATLFGFGRSFLNQACDSGNPYMGQLDPNYYMIYCNQNMSDQSSCGSSVHSLGSNACFVNDFTAEPRGTRGSVQPSVIDLAASATTAPTINIRLSAETFGSFPAVPTPNPNDPLGPPLMQPNPFFNASAGDQLHFNCAPPIGEHVISEAQGSVTVPVSTGSFTAPSTLTCSFFVTSSAGAIKGAIGSGQLQVIDSDNPSTGSGPIPPTTIPNPTINPGGAHDVDSGEV